MPMNQPIKYVEGQENRCLIVWFRVVKKLRYTDFIRDFKDKGLVMVIKSISTLNAPYLRYATLCGLNVVQMFWWVPNR